MRRSILRAALGSAAVATILIPAAPAGAIVGGTVDTVHTNVGLVRFTTTDGRFRCSGTLISPKVVLTAGHCTEGPATDVYVSFDNQLRPDPLAAGISPAEKAAREAFYIKGTAHPDPGWDGKLTFAKQHDQGVVVLAAAATTKWPAIKPAPLLPVGTLDGNQGALKNETFVLSGYGVDIGEKKAQIVNQQRMMTTAPLKSVQSEVVTFQNSSRRLQGRRRLVLRRLRRRRVPRRLRDRRRLVRELAHVQRDRLLPARGHPVLARVPGALDERGVVDGVTSR